MSWTIFYSSKHQQRELPAWWEGELCWSHNQLNSAAAGHKTSATNAQFEEGKRRKMKVMGFTARVQEKIPPHHLTTEWVFHLYERDTDVNLPTKIGDFFFLTFEISVSATRQQHLCAISVQLKSDVTHKSINSTSRKKSNFLTTHRNVSQIWNIVCTSLGKAT